MCQIKPVFLRDIAGDVTSSFLLKSDGADAYRPVRGLCDYTTDHKVTVAPYD